MRKPKEFHPMTKYLYKYIVERIWHYKDPEAYLDKIVRRYLKRKKLHPKKIIKRTIGGAKNYLDAFSRSMGGD